MVLVTDGILEARSPGGEFFGVDRMLENISSHRNLTASDIINALRQEIRDFTQCDELVDDLTAVVIKVDPPGTAQLEA